MRVCEAIWLQKRMLALGAAEGSPLAHIGSSTAEFREKRKPHIEQLLFTPLKAAGFEIVHIDIKDEPGVDMIGDLTDPLFQAELRQRGFKSAICANLLEHLENPSAIAAACEEIVGVGGHVLATAPYSYPYHPDPIDTLYRPSPTELATIFSRSAFIEGEVLVDGGLVGEEARKGWRHLALYPLAATKRLISVAWAPRTAYAQAHRLLWLVRNFKVSCCHLKVERLS